MQCIEPRNTYKDAHNIPIFQYARDGDADKIGELLGSRQDVIDHMFRVRKPGSPMGNPLHVAAKYGQLQCVQVIVEKLEEIYKPS
jgi:hypothetical protein